MMLSACQSGETTQLTTSGLDIADFDSTVQGKKTELVVLKNQNGMEACLTNYGGRLVSLCVPDKDGKMTDVVLGYDNIAQYADTLNSPLIMVHQSAAMRTASRTPRLSWRERNTSSGQTTT